MEYVDESIEYYKKHPTADEANKGILEKLISINKNIAILMAIDMLTAGVDTTSSALSCILYCIAKNPEKQEKLREEIMRVLPTKDSELTVENMKNLPYLRAVVKEGLRLFPPTVGTMRATSQDMVFQGYQIPRDSNVILCGMELYKDKAYFKKPKEFFPERWLKKSEEYIHCKPSHNFAYIPFGMGARMCIGKRLVFCDYSLRTFNKNIVEFWNTCSFV